MQNLVECNNTTAKAIYYGTAWLYRCTFEWCILYYREHELKLWQLEVFLHLHTYTKSFPSLHLMCRPCIVWMKLQTSSTAYPRLLVPFLQGTAHYDYVHTWQIAHNRQAIEVQGLVELGGEIGAGGGRLYLTKLNSELLWGGGGGGTFTTSVSPAVCTWFLGLVHT